MKTLIVDDEPAARHGIRRALKPDGPVYEAATLTAARKIMKDELPRLILLDLNLAGEDGFALLDESVRLPSPPKVIVITAHGNEKIAVEAMKKGAFDYLAKPFEIDELRMVVRNAAEQLQLAEENRILRSQLAATGGYGDMIGHSEPMRRVFQLVEQVADTDVTVLLTGPSGSGKELVAREIHARSPRSAGPLVSVNCAAIPETLIESELFGHEKGAFTGATERRIGKFERAKRGTLFLDEIGDMQAETQAKLLRVLEDRSIERLGGEMAIPVDVRIISATNHDLRELVRERKFREDLFYRLVVVEIQVPSLRHRVEDIPDLIDYFLKIFAGKHRRPVPEITREVMVLLTRYPYPGNVRQLRNIVERMLILNTSGTIVKEDLPDEIRYYVPGTQEETEPTGLEQLCRLDYRTAREEFETRYLMWNLREHDNNITHTAAAIGIHRQSLQQKIKDRSLRDFMGK